MSEPKKAPKKRKRPAAPIVETTISVERPVDEEQSQKKRDAGRRNILDALTQAESRDGLYERTPDEFNAGLKLEVVPMVSEPETPTEAVVEEPEPPSRITQLKEAMAHVKRGGVLNQPDIDDILAILYVMEPGPEPAEPDPDVVGRIGPDGRIHAYKWNKRTGAFDKDQGLATVTAVNPPPDEPEEEPFK